MLFSFFGPIVLGKLSQGSCGILGLREEETGRETCGTFGIMESDCSSFPIFPSETRYIQYAIERETAFEDVLRFSLSESRYC